jgi:hypothetical protein
MTPRRDDEEGISGGRFVDPGLLPPTRTVRLQGGRFVNPGVLPAEEVYRVGIDYDNAYHFGAEGGISILPDNANSGIEDAWLEARIGGTWTRVPVGGSVVAGAEIALWATWKSAISDGMALSRWSDCITAIDVNQRTIKNYAIKSITGASARHDNQPIAAISNGIMIMPAYALNIRFQVWGNSDQAPASPPTESLW